jgi:NADPH-dependent 7-cyano-7-deazaguanine reductase QueF
MKVAIMQPYFMPYIGYFQLIYAVDVFVIYNNIEYTKKGWINRNRILVNGQAEYISLPLKKDSDYLNIKDRYLSDDWHIERKKLLNRITESYRKAPYFSNVFPIIEEIINYDGKNLFQFIFNSLKIVTQYLEITTPFIISSSIQINHQLQSQKKVMELCKAKNATTYINPIGGVELYSREEFKENGIDLQFLKANNIQYLQLDNEFVPFLSIIDVMMFNTKKEIGELLKECSYQ